MCILKLYHTTFLSKKLKKKSKRNYLYRGPASVYGEDSPKCAEGIFDLGIPVLGICYGMQLMTYTLGGNVSRANTREYGTTKVNIDNTSPLFQGFEATNDFLMSHTDFVSEVPNAFKILVQQIIAQMPQWKMQKKNYMVFNSIQR